MKLKKIMAIMMVFSILGSVTACRNQADDSTRRNRSTASTKDQSEEKESTKTTAERETTRGQTADGKNILIAYFTWADNTHVDNPDEIDVDASTSASVLQPGNSALLADWIQDEVGGDLFSIVVKEPYSSDYDECLDRASEELEEDARPELESHVENMDQYDTVFLGFPNWWYGAPMAVLSFLEEYDFSGKTVIPFITHGTGGMANTIEDIEDVLPNDIKMLEPIGVYRPEVKESQGAIQDWVADMDI